MLSVSDMERMMLSGALKPGETTPTELYWEPEALWRRHLPSKESAARWVNQNKDDLMRTVTSEIVETQVSTDAFAMSLPPLWTCLGRPELRVGPELASNLLLTDPPALESTEIPFPVLMVSVPGHCRVFITQVAIAYMMQGNIVQVLKLGRDIHNLDGAARQAFALAFNAVALFQMADLSQQKRAFRRKKGLWRTWKLETITSLMSKSGRSVPGGGPEGQKLQVGHWVRGHFRNQPCGKDRADRRMRWIRPFFRGPEERQLSGRVYRA